MTATGGPQTLAVQDIPTPGIRRDTDMLVRLMAAGVNPVDTKLRQRGTLYPDRSPTVLGCDGAGVVEAVGPRVTRFRPGDAVYFCWGGIGGPEGNYAEYAVVDEAVAAPKPARLSFVEAAAAPLVLITAWESLHHRAHLRQGDAVLIHGGAGGVGHVAVQFAALAGARVAATVSSEEKAGFARSLGAERAIRYDREDWVAAALDWTGGRGVDVLLDTVGGETFARSCGAVRYGGDLVTILQPPPDMNWAVCRQRNLRISLEWMLAPMRYGLVDALREQAAILERCARLFDEGRLRVHVAATFPLAEAARAHAMLEAGGMTGKIVLTALSPLEMSAPRFSASEVLHPPWSIGDG